MAPRDERCDPRKIADAAARYLDVLTKRFGQDAGGVTLAMLAYNSGESLVARAIAELKAQSFQTVTWGMLVEHHAQLSVPLSPEGRNYAPRFFAAAILGENPGRFGLEIQPLSVYTTVM